MNPTQIQTTLAPLLSVVAGMLAAYLHFWDSGTWLAVLSAFLSFGGVLWGAVAARQTAMISTTANMAEVKGITLTQGASSALVAATPANVTK